MYTTCPKCSYVRKESDIVDAGVCPACGIIFSKWMKQKYSSPDNVTISTSEIVLRKRKDLFELLINTVLFIEPRVNNFNFYGRLFGLLLMIYLGWGFITMDFHLNPYPLMDSFLHNIHLIFHEAGHIVFIPFGYFMTILGGTLGQLIMPTLFMGSFLYKHNTFAASVALWWLAHSFMDIAPYVDDAKVQQLILLGGRTGVDAPGSHDWNNILNRLDRLEYCNDYANFSFNLGIALMLISFIWAAYILFHQYKNIDRRF